MLYWLSRAYRLIGIHTAPPGTLFYFVNFLVHRLIHRGKFRYASSGGFRRQRFGGSQLYNIKRQRLDRPVDGLALIFFFGAGDYLMATPFIRSLHLAYPDLPIYAYASSHSDNCASPLVAELLRTNPFIDKVFTYSGRPRTVWTDYDFRDALSNIPKDFIVLPVIYEVEPYIYHRTTSLLETFGLPVDLPISRPIAYPTQPSGAAVDLLDRINAMAAQPPVQGVVCCHLDARSSGYVYPHGKRLVTQLIQRGFVVVAFTPIDLADDRFMEIDVTTITPNDTMEILRSLKNGQHPVAMISINSIMWPISAALDIPNLGIHTFEDDAIHQYVYPNIFVLTRYFYEKVSPSRVFQARSADYKSNGPTFTDYNPDFVIDCFQTMVALPET
jgi:ADP-heptose:LPS heptosyltransferase